MLLLNPSLFRFLCPPLCPVCNREVAVSGSERGVCPGCSPGLLEARLTQAGRCPTCFYPRRGACSFCDGRIVYFDEHRSLFGLSDAWRSLVHTWKFDQERDLYRVFLPALNDLAGRFQEALPTENWRVTYIDSGREGFSRRSFRPCRDPARELARTLGLAWGADLRKIRNRQSSNTRFFRHFRVRGSLQVNGPVAENVILLEDVFTTGATANEAARILKKNGAKFVRVISLLFREDLVDRAGNA